MNSKSLSYAKAGVDIDAGDRAVELMKKAVAKTYNTTVMSSEGAFAGLVDASALQGYRHPYLASSTDGVGTKVAIAQAMDIHDTIGQDLVGMVVDDIVVMGAKPLFMTDYIATGKVVPERIADIVRGIADACAQVDTPLIGGETAEHPGLMATDEYDIAGAATGVVDGPKVLDPSRVQAGDYIVGLASSGLHSNGYSLVRAIIDHANVTLDDYVADLGRTVGEELLEPTRLYTKMCLQMIEDNDNNQDNGRVHMLSHITGGGLGANISRVIPQGMAAVIDRHAWLMPPVFQLMQKLGNVPWSDMEQTLNLGIGMVVICDEDVVDNVIETANRFICDATVIGEVVVDPGSEAAAVPAIPQEGSLNPADSKRVQISPLAQRAKDDPTRRVIANAKGVNAGSCILLGEYRFGL